MDIDDSGTKDDVLKLVFIDNVNMSSAKKITTCIVFIVEIGLVLWSLDIHGYTVSKI